MRKLRIEGIILITFFLLTTFQSIAQQADYNEAVRLYQEGQFEQSLEKFKALESKDYISAELWTNMANCYAKLNDVGHAVLYYERALKLKPGYKEAMQNLAISREYIKEPVIATEKFFFVRFYENMILPVRSTVWIMIALVSLMIASLLFYLKVKRALVTIPYKLWPYIAGFAILAAGLSALVYRTEHFDGYAVYMKERGILHSAPSEKSEEIIPLSPGLKCRKMDQIGDWIQIRLEDYQHGWVPSETLETI